MTATPFDAPLRQGPERTFAPASRRGALIPGVAAAVAPVLALVLIGRGLTLGVSFAAFAAYVVAIGLLAAGALAAYWCWLCLSLRYELERGVLRIRYGLSYHETPVALLERAVRGRRQGAVSVAGLDWPGCHIGRATVPRLGEVQFFSLHRSPAEVLYLAGDRGAYAISPGDITGFIQTLQNQASSESELREPRTVTHPLLHLAGGQERPARMALLAGAALALLATGIIFSRYAGLADQITMNFPEEQRVGDRGDLLGIPAAAIGLLVLNGTLGVVLSRRRRAAYTIICGLAFIEALLVVAAVTVV